MIAVIKTGGKQYKVSPKSKLKIEKIKGEEGAKFVFDQVLLTSSEDGKDINIGEPTIKDAKVEAKILKQARAKKIEVVKHKAKKRYDRRAGHRQFFTEVEIEKIVAA
ncbi:MAG: 50S ribosomal protein L21 [Patescibacteria group bacterium]|nr:50S ribosomal protein L21 [Patescibacteria group bacterium]